MPLFSGDYSKAKQLFSQINDQTEIQTAVAAEAAYQLGKLAENDINYKNSYQHYQRAIQLAPTSIDYLNSAGVMSSIFGHYKKAIGYYELALASYLKSYGADHPNTRTCTANLQSTLNSLEASSAGSVK